MFLIWKNEQFKLIHWQYGSL